MKKKRLYTILILFFTGIFALGAFQIYRQLREYGEGDSVYTDIEQYVRIEEEPEDESDGQGNESQSGESKPDVSWPVVDFAALAEINPDIVAWIYIEGTEINYPVVQGADNQYYLKHLFNGKWNSSGCIFLDSRSTSDFSDRHSVIYGHHMKNGTMFSGLTEYKKQEFYDAHPVILLMTPDQNFRVEIFAGYVASVKDNAWDIAMESDMKFETWLEEAKERSCFKSEVAPAVDTDGSIRKWNAGEIPVALIHPASAGHGLNLQGGGNTLVWFGLTWSLELYQQTVARLWRQGQESETVVVQHIITKGTIDEQIMKALSEKDTTQAALIDAVKADLKI